MENSLELSNIDKAFIVGIITSNKLVMNAETLSQFNHLKWIGRLGSGMEIIDKKYCDQNEIRYFSSPMGISNSVAEHLTGMLLSLLHKIPKSLDEIKNGNWNREINRGIELENLTVGIIGFGHTGSAFAKKLSGFTNSILVYDKLKSNITSEIIKEVPLEQLQDEADIISFHVPLQDDTFHYYDDAFMERMSKEHILINASRGAVANTSSILKGLHSGKISGACLDVLEEEKRIEKVLQSPNNIVNQLLNYNVIITPHIAGYSHDAVEKMSIELMRQILNL